MPELNLMMKQKVFPTKLYEIHGFVEEVLEIFISLDFDSIKLVFFRQNNDSLYILEPSVYYHICLEWVFL